MQIVLVVLAFLFLLTGLLGSVIPALPGPPLSFIGLLLIKWSGHGEFSFVFLAVWAAITLAVMIIDNFLPAWMTKRFGGSRAAVFGSVVGLILGMIFFAPLGLLIGPFLGALVGELINDRIQTKRAESNSGEAGSAVIKSGGKVKALKVALGAFFAFILGTGIKLIIGSLMIYYAVKAVFF
jgi:uncharacterized protein YqgC (DUF456 family)